MRKLIAALFIVCLAGCVSVDEKVTNTNIKIDYQGNNEKIQIEVLQNYIGIYQNSFKGGPGICGIQVKIKNVSGDLLKVKFTESNYEANSTLLSLDIENDMMVPNNSDVTADIYPSRTKWLFTGPIATKWEHEPFANNEAILNIVYEIQGKEYIARVLINKG